jgi:Mu transposase-like protein
MVTDAQVRLLRRKMMEKRTLQASAAAAGMSERAARKWRKGPLPSETKHPRSWRTRVDPFADVWEAEVVPLLRGDDAGILQATTIIQLLEERRPGAFRAGQVRTLQRRLRDWRALHGPAKEVYFEQLHVAGREAAVDFTHCTELGVTIMGRPFRHLLFQLVLSFSGWRWVTLAFGETYEALVAGVQSALWALGGVPAVLRSDNLSAATHELKHSAGRALNDRFRAVLDHYGLVSTRIRPGESHENGVVEQAHNRLKSALAQALIVRGSKDFSSVDAYMEFVRAVVDKQFNRHAEPLLAEERRLLRPLPSAPIPSFTTYRPIVRRWSTIRIGERVYSVPSRLVGHQVEARQHADVVEVLFKGQLVETMPRLHGPIGHRIDYHHIIWSLVRKPGAFARYKYREDLFPSMTFRRAYDALRSSRGDRADVEYVRILHLAASTMESTVEVAVALLLEHGRPFDYVAVRDLAAPERPAVPHVQIAPPDLSVYDALLAGGAR